MTQNSPGTSASGRVRSISALLLLVVAIVLTTPASVAYWGHRTITDAQRYLATIGPLGSDPAVHEAIITKVVSVLESQVDVAAIVDDVFAGIITDDARRARLAGAIAGGLTGLVEREVREFVTSDQFADVWTTVNATAQQGLIRLLEGNNSGPVSLQGDQVVLDVSDVIDLVKARLVQRGVTILQNVPIPAIETQIVLLDAPQLRQARTIYAFANPVAPWLLVGVAALYLAGFLLARRRARAGVVIGVGLLVNALLLSFVLTVGRQLFINELATTDFAGASAVFFDTLATYLERGWQVLALLGLVLIVGSWFAGRTAPAVATRELVGTGLERAGGSDAMRPVSGVGAWVGANVRWLRVVAVAIGVVILSWGNEATIARLGWALAATVALLVGLQILVGAGKPREPVPDASADPEAALVE